jgi:hypothetical protein
VRIVADGGLWSTGPAVADAPEVAVIELAGAVLAWTVDDPAGAAATRITFTDATAAEWLWRLVGTTGHAALLDALDGRYPSAPIDLPGIEVAAEPILPLRRLALGHWARRWWPVTLRDGIVGLDPAILDAELAVLTAQAQEFLDGDAMDGDVTGLLRRHRAALLHHRRGGDPRVVALVDAAVELADEVGAWDAADLLVVPDIAASERADYALAAGTGPAQSTPLAVASGVQSLNWASVPPGVFDAADETVDWRVEAVGSTAVATVRVATIGAAPATDVGVRLRSGELTAAGVLDADGAARLEIVDAGEVPLTESRAWNHDWAPTTVSVGADLGDSPEAAQARHRIREFARSRLQRPASDAFLAEILAAESDY